MPKKEIIRSEKAPKAIGPYNVAIRFGDLVFTAGQAGLVPETMELAPGGIAAETRQTLTNLKNSLEDIKANADEEISARQDADITQVAVDLARYQVLYEMSLQVAAKMFSMSLMDFIG